MTWPPHWNKFAKRPNKMKRGTKRTCSSCAKNCLQHKPNNKQPKPLSSNAYWTTAPKKNVPNANKPIASDNGNSAANNKRQPPPPKALLNGSAT